MWGLWARDVWSHGGRRLCTPSRAAVVLAALHTPPLAWSAMLLFAADGNTPAVLSTSIFQLLHHESLLCAASTCQNTCPPLPYPLSASFSLLALCTLHRYRSRLSALFKYMRVSSFQSSVCPVHIADVKNDFVFLTLVFILRTKISVSGHWTRWIHFRWQNLTFADAFFWLL